MPCSCCDGGNFGTCIAFACSGGTVPRPPATLDVQIIGLVGSNSGCVGGSSLNASLQLTDSTTCGGVWFITNTCGSCQQVPATCPTAYPLTWSGSVTVDNHIFYVTLQCDGVDFRISLTIFPIIANPPCIPSTVCLGCQVLDPSLSTPYPRDCEAFALVRDFIFGIPSICPGPCRIRVIVSTP